MRLLQILGTFLLLAFARTGRADFLIGSPHAPASVVDATGDVREDWGTMEVALIAPSTPEVTAQEYTVDPGPRVATTVRSASVVMTKTAYRSPIWRHGIDVLSVRLANPDPTEATPRVRVSSPGNVEWSESAGVAGGRTVVALPLDLQPLPRPERSWGWIGGSVAMRDWATPSGEGDPAFKNIKAGLGGVPIIYRFAVPPGAERRIVVGICESFYGDPKQRPLRLRVEGARQFDVSPLEAWGRHRPGCLQFAARDLNLDGYIEVISRTQDGAVDRNPILNVVWVFPPGEDLDLREVLRGTRSLDAEYYVDCGGDNDQSLYEPGSIEYELRLQPGEERTLTFLLACPGGGSVPDPARSAWTPRSLQKAAADVWLGWFGDRGPSVDALPDELKPPPDASVPE